MSQNTNTQQRPDSGLRKFAYASTIIGGGIVGTDYATWLNVSPLVGTILGAIVSAMITAFLFHLKDDPGGQIKEGFTFLGGFIGLFFGIYVAVNSDANWLICLVIFTALGAGLGQMVAGLISVAAIVLLFISRGPIGAFLREAFLSAGIDPAPLDAATFAVTASHWLQGLKFLSVVSVASLMLLPTARAQETAPAKKTTQEILDDASPMALRLFAKQRAEESGDFSGDSAAAQARRWLRDNGGIAIIIGDGTEDTAAPEELGKAIVKRFWESHHVKAAYFVHPDTTRVNTLTFENRYFPLGRGLIDKKGRKTGIYTPSMWATKEQVEALFEEIYLLHIASLKRQTDAEKRQ